MRLLPPTRSCFGCGRTNPSGLRLQIETDGQVVQARFMPRPEHAGFKNIVHGGILTTVADELMAWACGVAAHRFAFCAELATRFLHPARVGEELLATAELVSNRKNKLFEVRSSILRKELIISSAAGKYLVMKETDMEQALGDFEVPPDQIFGPPA